MTQRCLVYKLLTTKLLFHLEITVRSEIYLSYKITEDGRVDKKISMFSRRDIQGRKIGVNDCLLKLTND